VRYRGVCRYLRIYSKNMRYVLKKKGFFNWKDVLGGEFNKKILRDIY
jgi:hypothetical protein